MKDKMSGFPWRKVRTALAVGAVAFIFGWLYTMVLIGAADHLDMTNFILAIVAGGGGFGALLLTIGILGANGYALPDRLAWMIVLALGVVALLHLIGSFIPVRDVQLFTLYAPATLVVVAAFGLFMRWWLNLTAEVKKSQL